MKGVGTDSQPRVAFTLFCSHSIFHNCFLSYMPRHCIGKEKDIAVHRAMQIAADGGSECASSPRTFCLS